VVIYNRQAARLRERLHRNNALVGGTGELGAAGGVFRGLLLLTKAGRSMEGPYAGEGEREETSPAFRLTSVSGWAPGLRSMPPSRLL